MDSITALATNGVSEVWSVLFNFLAFIVVAGLLFFFAQRAGRGPFIALMASFYIGLVVYLVFPYKSLLGTSASSAVATALTAIVLYLIFVGISYYILRRNTSGGFFSMGTGGTVILAALTAGFLIALSYHSFSIGALYQFPAPIETYFAPAQYFFWWFIAPLVGLLIIAR